MKQMVHIGMPLALQNAMIAFSCVVLQSVINSFGTVIVAAFTATNRIENLVGQIYIALNTALSNYTAQNLGARDTDRERLSAVLHDDPKMRVNVVVVLDIVLVVGR